MQYRIMVIVETEMTGTAPPYPVCAGVERSAASGLGCEYAKVGVTLRPPLGWGDDPHNNRTRPKQVWAWHPALHWALMRRSVDPRTRQEVRFLDDAAHHALDLDGLEMDAGHPLEPRVAALEPSSRCTGPRSAEADGPPEAHVTITVAGLHGAGGGRSCG